LAFNLQLLAVGLLVLVSCLRAPAQYSLDWWTVDGGGGQSTGSVFTVTGTIGQPDAGVMTGGNFPLPVGTKFYRLRKP
jgi:hypothetical protein